jgi:DNA segregation ATPase FtsK/SpoIIIE, S-DNA-T family
MLAQLAALHPPGDLAIWIAAARQNLPIWEWAKWLPHTQNPAERDAVGPARVIADTLPRLESLGQAEFSGRPPFAPGAPPAQGRPHIVTVIDGATGAGVPDSSPLGGAGAAGVTVIELAGPGPYRAPDDPDGHHLLLSVADGALGAVGANGTEIIGSADALSIGEAEALARQLASLSNETGRAEQPLADDLTLTDLLGTGDPASVDAEVRWRPRPPRDQLRIPIGVGTGGAPVHLDLKESAEEGMGPHGLVIGATGSGKSELLRTLVLGLAITHSPERLNLVLIDFKGGATFAGLAGLPHTAALITNLAEDMAAVERMSDALQGELIHRQELLKRAGNFASVRDYERARSAGSPLEPLPSLLIICDEFSELLTAKPDFIDLFVAIGRLGRSLGLHLLLASQRLEEGRLRGLDSHLSYRIGLRTFSAAESRVVLGVPDAYELPSLPGSGYLKAGTGTLTRFKAAYVSGPYQRPGGDRAAVPQVPGHVLPFLAERVDVTVTPGHGIPAEPDDRTQPFPVLPRHAYAGAGPRMATGAPREADGAVPRGSHGGAPSAAAAAGESMLDVVVRQLGGRGRGRAAHQIWLPPLSDPPTLDQLFGGLAAMPGRGLGQRDRREGPLRVPVGIEDRPLDQRRDPLMVDLSGSAGHVAVVGGPRSGKSTTLRTLIASLALTHTPAEAQFYCLDFGGGGLSALAGLPHVGGVASRLDRDRVRRTIAEMTALMAERERRFHEAGVEGIAALRARLGDDGDRDGELADVFLVIDNWAAFRQEFEQLEPAVIDLAGRGLGFGIHLVVAASRWMDLRTNLRDLFGTMVEMRLGDPSESVIDRRAAGNVPEGRPGRLLSPAGLHALAALPRIDGQQQTADLADGVRGLVSAVAAAWQGPSAPAIRLLPDKLLFTDMPAAGVDARNVPVGIKESDLGPAALDFAADPHFLCFGDVECGKTSLLRTILRGLTARYTAQQARVIIVDYRRTLLDAAAGDHLLEYLTSGNALAPVIADVCGSMSRRLPGPDVTPQHLRDRSWWPGPELFVVVDDYDLVATSGSPLAPLADYLPQGRDIGLHLILARASGGAGRALFDPVIQRLREMATPGLIMSGSRGEGELLGDVRPSPLPPGRGTLVRRRTGAELIQVAWSPASDGEGA